jgi:hypothetical protein
LRLGISGIDDLEVVAAGLGVPFCPVAASHQRVRQDAEKVPRLVNMNPDKSLEAKWADGIQKTSENGTPF